MPRSGTRHEGWVTTTEAAQRLGVKRATLYAYVSRGLLRSERRPGQQESLFARAEIDAMAASTRVASAPRTLLRFRAVASDISSQVDGGLRYRGVPLEDVVAFGDLERAARLVVGAPAETPDPTDAQTPAAPAGMPQSRVRVAATLARVVPRLPLERRMPVAVQLLAAADPFAGDSDPDRARAAALSIVPAAVRLLLGAPSARRPPESDGDLVAQVVRALGGQAQAPGHLDTMRTLLVSLLDHGLTASTVAARVAASTRAGLADCLAAAYAAMVGPLHGAAPSAAYRLVTAGPDPVAAVARSLREESGVPGFGHSLYPNGDPRADLVLDAVWRLPGTDGLRARVEALVVVMHERTGLLPNIDLASAAALHALGLPAESGEVVFQVARSFGVAAQVAEEYLEEPLRWRGRDSSG